MKQCPKCHTQWEDAKRFCPYDGAPLPNAPAPTSPNPEFQATNVMNPAQVPLANPVPTSVQPVFQQSGVNPTPTGLTAGPPTEPAPGGSPPPSRSPLLRPTDDTPTVKASRPLDAWPPPHNPAPMPEPPLALVNETEGLVFENMPTSEPAPSRPAGPPPGQLPPPATPSGGFPANPWGGDLDDGLGFHFDAISQPLTPVGPPLEAKTVPAPPPIAAFVNPQQPINPEEIPKTMSVFQVAQQALDKKRGQTGGYAAVTPRRSHAEYFQLLNERNRIVQQFVELLSKQGFHYTTSYSNKDDHLLYKFLLMFGDEMETRAFPISVALHRKPHYAVVVSIDLHDIGDNLGDRTKRTEQLGGIVERNERGITFRLDATEDIPNEFLMRWLDENFKTIFQFAYES